MILLFSSPPRRAFAFGAYLCETPLSLINLVLKGGYVFIEVGPCLPQLFGSFSSPRFACGSGVGRLSESPQFRRKEPREWSPCRNQLKATAPLPSRFRDSHGPFLYLFYAVYDLLSLLEEKAQSRCSPPTALSPYQGGPLPLLQSPLRFFLILSHFGFRRGRSVLGLLFNLSGKDFFGPLTSVPILRGSLPLLRLHFTSVETSCAINASPPPPTLRGFSSMGIQVFVLRLP